MKQVRQFAMSYPELAQRGDRIVILSTRDLDKLSNYGYTPDLSVRIRTLTDRFKSVESDMYWEGHQTREHLTALLDKIRFKAKLALGEKSKEYKILCISGMHKLSDIQPISYTKHVCATATYFKEKLVDRNVNDAMLIRCLALTNELGDSIDEQTSAISMREQKSVEHIDFGNELYEIISETSEVGKRIWENKNQAFYDDYVLYGSSKSSAADDNEEEEELIETNS